MIKIYILEKNNVPFYVGKTKNVIRRINKHYIKFGEDIKIIVIDEIIEQEWKFWEKYWIEQFTQWGFELENKNKGGGGPTKWTQEQKELINPERINKIINHKTRGSQISKTLKQKNHSKYYTQDVKDKMSKKLKGISKNFTEEHKINLAKANLESKGKIVECYTLSDEYMLSFSCLREAAEWLIKDQPNISKNVAKQIKDCCNGRQKKCHGYKFKYE